MAMLGFYARPSQMPMEPLLDSLDSLAPPSILAATAVVAVVAAVAADSAVEMPKPAARAPMQSASAPAALDEDAAKHLLTMAKKTDKQDKKKKGKKHGDHHQHDVPAAVAADPVAAAAAATALSGEATAEDLDEPMRKIVASSWKRTKALKDAKGKGKGGSGEDGEADFDDEGGSADLAQKSMSKGKASGSSPSGGGGGFFSFGRKSNKKGEEDGDKASESNNMKGNNGGAIVPDNFDDMMLFNARMIGANVSFIDLILKAFDTLVSSVVSQDDFRLQKETRIISLRLYAEKHGSIKFKEFKICMLASLRPLLPSLWDSQHERAWEWLWDTVAENMNKSIELPNQYHRKVDVLVNDLSLDEKRTLGLNVFKRLFKMNPQTEFYFKQNNERLAFIVRSALEFSAKIFNEPAKTVDDLTALGLKHIMWSIPTEYFEPFLICCVQEVQEKCGSDNLEPFAWALEIVASVLVLTIEDGSSPLLTAVLKNNPKAVRKELGKLPRAQRPASAVGAIATELA